MNSNNMAQNVHIIGPIQNGGSYILQITIKNQVVLNFGRFQGGKKYTLSPGQYIYIGSALTKANRPALLQRTARHATRTHPNSPHKIIHSLKKVAAFHHLDPNQILLKSNKKMHWHMDYLLENQEIEIGHIILIPSSIGHETLLAQSFAKQKGVSIPIPNLGASDTKGDTHFLRIEIDITSKELLSRTNQIVNKK